MSDIRKDYVEKSSMRLTTLYIDDITKMKVIEKLRTLPFSQDVKKGTLAPTIRVLLNMYANGEIDIDPARIEAEYTLTTKKNKRSSL